MTPSQIQAALTAAGLGPQAAALANLARPAIHLTAKPVDEGTLAIGASKLGGMPDLPTGAVWPQGKTLPLAFIAQIRLADAAPYDPEHALPATGLLAFFYDAQQQTFGDQPTDRGNWLVSYIPDATKLQRATPPAALPANARFHACAVTFAATLTMPQQPNVAQPTLPWTPDIKQKYEQFWANFPSQQERATPQDQLLGYPDTLQDDMRLLCVAGAHGMAVSDAAPNPALNAETANWRLLFQIDSDKNAGMDWGDAGMLYYWMQRADLAACRFDQSWLVLQSE